MKFSVAVETIAIFIGATLLNSFYLLNSANAIYKETKDEAFILDEYPEKINLPTDEIITKQLPIATVPNSLEEVESQLPEIQTAQVYPSQTNPDIIEKIKPPIPQPVETDPNPRETGIETLEEPEKTHHSNQREIILEALTVSASKYPWLINPTDNLTFYPQLFKPNKDENYLDFDIKFAEQNPIINKFTFAHSPKKDQFYWVLPDNKVVFETKAWQGGILHQGRTADTKLTQTVTLEQSLGGFQVVSLIPQKLEDLTGEVQTKDFSVLSIAGQQTNPRGIPAGEVIINSGIDPKNPNVTILENPIPNLGSGSTLSSDGGGSLFQYLDVSNAPLILQGFPTVDLKPLLNDGNVRLVKGEVIPKEVLEAAGIFWGDIVTGKPSRFTAPITSLPGVKVGQLGKFDNVDLLNTLVNPFQTDLERDLHYLNSLFWVSFGQRQPKFNVSINRQDEDDWYRVYASRAHNRTLIEYDPVNISATYANVFANPGTSLTVNFEDGKIDGIQTANSTLGMALGLIFEGVNINNLQHHLEDAKQKFENGEGFAALKTQASSLQRRQINYRLNRTLSYANLVSGLKQVSGTVTIPSQITPNDSSLFQVRTGLHRRGVQFLQRNIGPLIEGDTFFSRLRLSNEDFGPLTFIGVPLPLTETSITPINESAAAEVILTNPDGRSFVQRFSSADNTIIPIGIQSSDIAFDRIELTRIDRQNIRFRSFNGYLSLPAVELLVAGSVGNFNYSISSGMWVNLHSDSTPGVSKKNIGLQEPAVGIYTNALLSFQKVNVERDAENQPKAINTYTPFLSINWNSASNRINPFYANLSYSYSHQEKNFGFSLIPGIAFIKDSSNGEWIGLLTGQFGIRTGLEFKTNIEIGKDIFFDLEALQKISPNISIGTYLKNFSLINVGLDSRVSNLNYGVILRHNFTDNNIFIEAQIGTGERGFDARLEGGYRF